MSATTVRRWRWGALLAPLVLLGAASAPAATFVVHSAAGPIDAFADGEQEDVADIALSNPAHPETVPASGELVYTLTALNKGPATAHDVVIADTLPSQVTFRSATTTQGTCAYAAGIAYCDVGTIEAGASVTVTVKATAPRSGCFTNEALASGTTYDPYDNNAVSAETCVGTVPPRKADVYVSKTAHPDPMIADGELVYTTVVGNRGPDAAEGVFLSDVLPPEVAFQSASTTQGSCALVAGAVQCQLGTIANGGEATVSIKLFAPFSGCVEGEAIVGGNTTDPDNTNNTAKVNSCVADVPAHKADVYVTKSAHPSPVPAEGELVYTVVVGNKGPDAAEDVFVSDLLPLEVSYKSADTTQGSCDLIDGAVQCQLGTLAYGDEATVTITVLAPYSGCVENEVVASGITEDPDYTNNVATVTTCVADPPPAKKADVYITKSAYPDPVPSEGELAYTVIVANKGPDAAEGVFLSDLLPGEVAFKSAHTTQGSCDLIDGAVQCQLGTIEYGTYATVTITVLAPFSGCVENEVLAGGVTEDPDYSNNVAKVTTCVEEPPPEKKADVYVTKSAYPDPVPAGGELAYTVIVANKGPDAAEGVFLGDVLPGEVAFKSADTTQGSCDLIDGAVQCHLGTIAHGAYATVSIKVLAPYSGCVENEVLAGGVTEDPDYSNNVAMVRTCVAEPPPEKKADVYVTKSAYPDPVPAGGELAYTVIVANKGPDAAEGVFLSDVLPGEVAFKSADTTQGSCDLIDGAVQCHLGTIAHGAYATVSIKVTAPYSGCVENEVLAGGVTEDPDYSNNVAMVRTCVADPPPEKKADVYVTKRASPDPVRSEGELVYTVVVGNKGPDSAEDVFVSDLLPLEVAFKSAHTTQGSCDLVDGAVQCQLGTLAYDGEATVTITVLAPHAGCVENEVFAGGTTEDPDYANNTAMVTTCVVEPPAKKADVYVTKSAYPDPVSAGGELVYTVVVANKGPDAAEDVFLSDVLPGEVAFKSADTTQGACALVDGAVQCQLGTIAYGAYVTVSIKVTAPHSGCVENEVLAGGVTEDPDYSNNSAKVTTCVEELREQADLYVTKSAPPGPALGGDRLVYTITVGNKGPHAAKDVVVADQLPYGVAYESAQTSQGACEEKNGRVQCHLGALASGAEARVYVSVRLPEKGCVTNEAHVSSGTEDPDAANDHASVRTCVVERPKGADLSLQKTADRSEANLGEVIRYQLVVRNLGNMKARQVKVVDWLPNHSKVVSYASSQGKCYRVRSNLECDVGELSEGGSATVELVLQPQKHGTFVNKASVRGREHDPNWSNNDSEARVNVIESRAELRLDVNASAKEVRAGGELVYTLVVHNQGPHAAVNVDLENRLSKSLDFKSVWSSAGQCGLYKGRYVRCSLDRLPAGEKLTVKIVTRVTGLGQIQNKARVVTDSKEKDPRDNLVFTYTQSNRR